MLLSSFLFPSGHGCGDQKHQARLQLQRGQDFVAGGATVFRYPRGDRHRDRSIAAGQDRIEVAGVGSAGVLAFAVLVLRSCQIRSVVVLLPVIIYMGDKDFMAALLITIYLLVVGLADNVLKPMLMGRGTDTPAVVIFISLLGGTIAHGIVGLFIRPIILGGRELAAAWICEGSAASAEAEKVAAWPCLVRQLANAGKALP